METLLVFFSRSGHTRRLAQEIARACAADLEELHEPRGRAGMLGYLRSGLQAMREVAPPIRPGSHDPARYRRVILGTPVWVGRPAAPMRSYALRHAGRFPTLGLFCTLGGSGAQRCFEELAGCCGRQPVATLAVTEAQLAGSDYAEALQRFVAQMRA